MSTLNILLVIFMVATLAVLIAGLVGMFRGGEFNARYGNKLMRARVGLQFAALVIIGLIFLAQ